jgi:hypothetical protein
VVNLVNLVDLMVVVDLEVEVALVVSTDPDIEEKVVGEVKVREEQVQEAEDVAVQEKEVANTEVVGKVRGEKAQEAEEVVVQEKEVNLAKEVMKRVELVVGGMVKKEAVMMDEA